MPREVPFEIAGLIEESCARFEKQLKERLGAMAGVIPGLRPYIENYRIEAHRIVVAAYQAGLTKGRNETADASR